LISFKLPGFTGKIDFKYNTLAVDFDGPILNSVLFSKGTLVIGLRGFIDSSVIFCLDFELAVLPPANMK